MAENPFDVVVVGSVGIDTNVYFYGAGPDFDVESNFTENIDYVGQAGGYVSRGMLNWARRPPLLAISAMTTWDISSGSSSLTMALI